LLCGDLITRNLIVAIDLNWQLWGNLAQPLDEVPGEGVVVVNQ
jgi:hypothetical protein